MEIGCEKKGSLDIGVFTEYFVKGKLGHLVLPNGNFKISLNELYKASTGFGIDRYKINHNEILSIIVFGSSVRYPSYHLEKRKKHFWSKELVNEKIFIIAKDVDLIVITKNHIPHELLIPPLTSDWRDSCGCHSLIIWGGGMHVLTRSKDEIVDCQSNNDTISSSSMREGVPLFCSSEFDYLRDNTGIKKQNPNQVHWVVDNNGKLNGSIS